MRRSVNMEGRSTEDPQQEEDEMVTLTYEFLRRRVAGKGVYLAETLLTLRCAAAAPVAVRAALDASSRQS